LENHEPLADRGILDGLLKPKRQICGQNTVPRAVSCKWPKSPVRLAISSTWSITDGQRAWEIFNQVADEVARVCGLKIIVVDDQPDILVTSGAIDGAGRTLAYAQFPCGWYEGREPYLQKYDREAYGTQGYPSLAVVALHETGHSVGLDHSNEPDSVMNPSLTSAKPFRFGVGDARRLAALYGPPVASQPTPPTLPPVTPPQEYPWAPWDVRIVEAGITYELLRRPVVGK
jgi:hypothetical protein